MKSHRSIICVCSFLFFAKLRDQLGLVLLPGQRDIDFLVVREN
jgi:hypothetical protein